MSSSQPRVLITCWLLVLLLVLAAAAQPQAQTKQQNSSSSSSSPSPPSPSPAAGAKRAPASKDAAKATSVFDVFDALSSASNLSMFREWLEILRLNATHFAAGVPVTILAPTDQAIRELLTRMGLTEQQAKQRPELLDELVGYHILPLVRPGASLTALKLSSSSAQPTTARSVKPGYTLAFWAENNGPDSGSSKAPRSSGSSNSTATVYVRDVQGNTARVSEPGVVAGNVTLFKVDRVLLNGDVFTSPARFFAHYPRFSLFALTAAATGLSKAWNTSGFSDTLLVPRNALLQGAINSRAAALADEGPEAVTDLTRYHVVQGYRPIPAGWKASKWLPTALPGHAVGMNSTRVTVTSTAPKRHSWSVHAHFVLPEPGSASPPARVTGPNFFVGAGVVHAIHGVLLPAEASAGDAASGSSGGDASESKSSSKDENEDDGSTSEAQATPAGPPSPSKPEPGKAPAPARQPQAASRDAGNATSSGSSSSKGRRLLYRGVPEAERPREVQEPRRATRSVQARPAPRTEPPPRPVEQPRPVAQQPRPAAAVAPPAAVASHPGGAGFSPTANNRRQDADYSRTPDHATEQSNTAHALQYAANTQPGAGYGNNWARSDPTNPATAAANSADAAAAGAAAAAAADAPSPPLPPPAPVPAPLPPPPAPLPVPTAAQDAAAERAASNAAYAAAANAASAAAAGAAAAYAPAPIPPAVVPYPVSNYDYAPPPPPPPPTVIYAPNPVPTPVQQPVYVPTPVPTPVYTPVPVPAAAAPLPPPPTVLPVYAAAAPPPTSPSPSPAQGEVMMPPPSAGPGSAAGIPLLQPLPSAAGGSAGAVAPQAVAAAPQAGGGGCLNCGSSTSASYESALLSQMQSG